MAAVEVRRQLLWHPDHDLRPALSADGTELAGPAVELLRNDQSWEREVVEAPSMIEVDGEYHLFIRQPVGHRARAVGHAVCESVADPA